MSLRSLVLSWLRRSEGAPAQPAEVRACISVIQTYANSFLNLSVAETKIRLAGAELKEEPWNEGDVRDERITATFPDYELQVYFLQGRVIKTSIQVRVALQ